MSPQQQTTSRRHGVVRIETTPPLDHQWKDVPACDREHAGDHHHGDRHREAQNDLRDEIDRQHDHDAHQERANVRGHEGYADGKVTRLEILTALPVHTLLNTRRNQQSRRDRRQDERGIEHPHGRNVHIGEARLERHRDQEGEQHRRAGHERAQAHEKSLQRLLLIAFETRPAAGLTQNGPQFIFDCSRLLEHMRESTGLHGSRQSPEVLASTIEGILRENPNIEGAAIAHTCAAALNEYARLAQLYDEEAGTNSATLEALVASMAALN